MNTRRLVLASALAIPALLLPLSSCNESKESPGAPNIPSIGSPRAPSGRAGINDHKIRLPQPSAARLAEAVKADLAAENVTTAVTAPRARHNPVLVGQTLDCVDGASAGFPPATSDPFVVSTSNNGCELNTLGPGGGASFALPVSNQTRGKLVANTTRLEAYVAGGPHIGGAPRFSIFTDFCLPAGPGCSTDGVWDETLFIDVNGCNDGDGFVAAMIVKASPNSGSDPTCQIVEAYGPDGIPNNGDEHVHPNWNSYVGAHPKDRFAHNFGPFSTPPNALVDNFIIAEFDVTNSQGQHYLVYRVRMAATGSVSDD